MESRHKATQALEKLRDSALALIETTPALNRFAPPPSDLQPTDLAPRPVPGIAHLCRDPGKANGQTAAFTRHVLAAAPFAHWRRSYSEEQVGADFRARYGWFELWGPSGSFHSAKARAYVAYWGAHLWYDWHFHEAEELYFVAAGGARFLAEGAADVDVSTGGTRLHSANQPHAMRTSADPVLTLILWRGAGLDGSPQMGTPT